MSDNGKIQTAVAYYGYMWEYGLGTDSKSVKKNHTGRLLQQKWKHAKIREATIK